MPSIGLPEIAVVVLMLLMFVSVPVSLILILARSIRRDAADAATRDPAVDAVRTRFASREIDETEFERLRSILQRR